MHGGGSSGLGQQVQLRPLSNRIPARGCPALPGSGSAYRNPYELGAMGEQVLC
jgi:hypothetical protein